MSKIVPAAAIGLPNSSGFRARARQALPVHRQPDRCPRRSRASAGRFFADAEVSGDRGGEGAVRGARPFVSGIRFGVSNDRYPTIAAIQISGALAFAGSASGMGVRLSTPM